MPSINDNDDKEFYSDPYDDQDGREIAAWIIAVMIVLIVWLRWLGPLLTQ